MEHVDESASALTAEDAENAAQWLQGIGSGAATGVTTGMAAGPFGALVGGLLGAGMGAIQTAQQQQARLRSPAVAPRIGRPPPPPPAPATPAPVAPAPVSAPVAASSGAQSASAIAELQRLLPLLTGLAGALGAARPAARPEDRLGASAAEVAGDPLYHRHVELLAAEHHPVAGSVATASIPSSPPSALDGCLEDLDLINRGDGRSPQRDEGEAVASFAEWSD